MSFTLTNGFRFLSTMPCAAGLGMIAMGVGLTPVDPELWAVAEAVVGDWIVPHQQPFLFVLGSVKLLGGLGLWGIGPFGQNGIMPALALGIPAFCAVFGHNAVGDGKAVGPAIYLVLFAIYHYLSSKEEDKAKKA